MMEVEQPWAALEPTQAQLCVSRTAPHVVLAATQPWLAAAGFSECEALGRAFAVLLQGDGTCMATAGALWTALQVRFALPNPS